MVRRKQPEKGRKRGKKAKMKANFLNEEQNAELRSKGLPGGVSNTPLRNPLSPNFGGKKSVMKHFDYWTFHIQYRRNRSCGPDEADMNLLGIMMELCKVLRVSFRYEEGRGGDGFRKSLVVSEEIHLLYDATYVEEEDEDVMRVDIKGRELAMFVERGGDLKELYGFMKKYNGFMKRVDLAVDLFEPTITLDEIKDKLGKGEVSCKSKKWQVMPDYGIGSTIPNGESVYIGDRRSSRRYMNIYDKLAEQLAKKKEVEEEYWLRFELRMEDQWADDFVSAYFESDGNRGNVFDGAIRDFVDFKESIENEGHKNRDNRAWGKWLDLLDGHEPVNVALKRPDLKSMEKKIDWLERSCSKSLAMLYLSHKMQEEDGIVSFIAHIEELVEIGINNLDNCDLNVLQNYCGESIDSSEVETYKKRLHGDFYRAQFNAWLSDEAE